MHKLKLGIEYEQLKIAKTELKTTLNTEEKKNKKLTLA